MPTTTIRLSDEEYEALSAESEQQQRSKNEIIREALRWYVDQKQKQRNAEK